MRGGQIHPGTWSTSSGRAGVAPAEDRRIRPPAVGHNDAASVGGEADEAAVVQGARLVISGSEGRGQPGGEAAAAAARFRTEIDGVDSRQPNAERQRRHADELRADPSVAQARRPQTAGACRPETDAAAYITRSGGDCEQPAEDLPAGRQAGIAEGASADVTASGESWGKLLFLPTFFGMRITGLRLKNLSCRL